MKQVSKILLCLAVLVYSFDTMAKLSSNSVKNQVVNIEYALSKCNFSADVLNEIKSKTVGGTVSSGVATIGSGVATTTSIIAAVKSSKYEYHPTNGDNSAGTTSTTNTTNGTTSTNTTNTQNEGGNQSGDGKKNKTDDKSKTKKSGTVYDTSTEDRRDGVKKLNSSLKNLRVASAIASGVATGANLVTVTLSGTSVSQLGKLMDDADDCEGALNSITISEK